MSTLRRALVLTELDGLHPSLAIDSEAIARIADLGEFDTPATWLPARVFGPQPKSPSRRALLLVDGERVEVPTSMRLLESVEVLAIPDLLRATAERGGITGLAVLPAGLALFCDPRRIAGAHDEP